MTSLNRILVLIILVATISLLLSSPSLANADIKVTPPPNWQPAPDNNSTRMGWFQNSTKSIFAIGKAPGSFPSMPLSFVGAIVAQNLLEEGVLESADQLSFGQSNYGYRYMLNLPSFSNILNSTSNPSISFPEMKSMPPFLKDNAPLKGMVILTQKQDDLYMIIFLNPRDNFDSVLNEIKPTIDSIQLTNSTATATNQTLSEQR
jgi:hypothetical protein